MIGTRIEEFVGRFTEQKADALVLLKPVERPGNFGVAVVDERGVGSLGCGARLDLHPGRRSIVQHYRLPPEKVRVIQPGYDPNVFFSNGFDPFSAPSEEPYLLYVGNVLPHKNLLRVLDALAILWRRRPCRLLIRGEGRPAHVQAVRERVETLGLCDAVAFLEYTEARGLRDLYTRAACLVLPSMGEGFGLPVLEAMACGTPVVTANTSSLPEVAGDAALLVDPNDAVALADAVHRVLTDRDLREDLRRRGFQRAALFSWGQTAEQVSKLLDAIRDGGV